jgi:hypothetical protein
VGKKFFILNDFVNRVGVRSFQGFYLKVACADQRVVLVGNVCAGKLERVVVVQWVQCVLVWYRVGNCNCLTWGDFSGNV